MLPAGAARIQIVNFVAHSAPIDCLWRISHNIYRQAVAGLSRAIRL